MERRTEREATNRILKKALENLARKVIDEISESSVHTLVERMIEDAKDE